MKVNKASRLVLLIEELNSGDFQRNNQWTTVLSTMTCERSLERMEVGEGVATYDKTANVYCVVEVG